MTSRSEAEADEMPENTRVEPTEAYVSTHPRSSVKLGALGTIKGRPRGTGYRVKWDGHSTPVTLAARFVRKARLV